MRRVPEEQEGCSEYAVEVPRKAFLKVCAADGLKHRKIFPNSQHFCSVSLNGKVYGWQPCSDGLP